MSDPTDFAASVRVFVFAWMVLVCILVCIDGRNGPKHQ